MSLMRIVTCIMSVTNIVLAESVDCYDFWTRWWSCPSMSQFPHSTSACFKSVDKTFVFLNYEMDTVANILCDYRIVDIELFTCLGVNHLENITFDNCIFPTQSVREVLKRTNPKQISVTYNQTQYVDKDILFDQLPETEVIIIVGARSTKKIDISFEDIPFLKTISLYETDYLRSNSRLRMLPSLINFACCRCSLNNIPEGFFNDSSSLIHVNLGYNCLDSLPDGIFSSLSTIYTIRLNHNCFTSIRSEWFGKLSSLLYLDLSYNRLISIPDNIFSFVRNIAVFNISSNLQITLNGNTLHNAKNLEELIINNCSLTSVPPDLLKNARRLSVFSISRNNLIRVPPDLFSNQISLRKICLANNRLTDIPTGLFLNLDSVRTLLIHNNEIQSIADDTFSGLSNLVELDLHSNKLDALNSSVFADLNKLRILDLSRNRLETLSKVNPFGSSEYLQFVNISRNSLDEFPSFDWSLHDVMEIDGDYNVMATVYLNPIGKKGTIVTLRNNPIATIRMTETHTNEEQLVQFILDSSTLNCNCDLQEFLSFVGTSVGKKSFVNVTKMTCFQPKERKGVLVAEIPIHEVCPLKRDCPTGCSCFVTIKQSVLTNCSNAGFIHAPQVIPFGTSVVHLENNNIGSLSNVESLSWSNVTELYLTNNSLSSLENWTIPRNLQVLTIDENKLGSLPLALMEKVNAVPHFQISLAENEWRCDCYSVPFKEWFTKNKYKITDYNNTLCTRNNEGNKTLIINMPVDLFCPIRQSVLKSQISAIIISVLSIAMLLICFSIIYHRYNNTVMAYLYSHNLYFRCFDGEDVDEDKIFDAFVCYSTVDREIAMTIMHELEPSLRLCIHERDWLPGYPISHHIVNSVQGSRKTLLLVSKDFLESIWFQVEFRTAYNQMLEDKMHRLVLIMINELGDISHLDADLRHLMSTKTYLQWGEKWFWEKLRFSLRSHRSKRVNSFVKKEKRHSCNTEGFVQNSTVSVVS